MRRRTLRQPLRCSDHIPPSAPSPSPSQNHTTWRQPPNNNKTPKNGWIATPLPSNTPSPSSKRTLASTSTAPTSSTNAPAAYRPKPSPNWTLLMQIESRSALTTRVRPPSPPPRKFSTCASSLCSVYSRPMPWSRLPFSPDNWDSTVPAPTACGGNFWLLAIGSSLMPTAISPPFMPLLFHAPPPSKHTSVSALWLMTCPSLCHTMGFPIDSASVGKVLITYERT